MTLHTLVFVVTELVVSGTQCIWGHVSLAPFWRNSFVNGMIKSHCNKYTYHYYLSRNVNFPFVFIALQRSFCINTRTGWECAKYFLWLPRKFYVSVNTDFNVDFHTIRIWPNWNKTYGMWQQEKMVVLVVATVGWGYYGISWCHRTGDISLNWPNMTNK